MEIDIDFDVFKALTALRRDEGHSYNDVLRTLLKLEQPPMSPIAGAANAMLASVVNAMHSPRKSFATRHGDLPHGTRLRASYKGIEHTAVIEDGRWITPADDEFASASAAAKAITGTNVNGLRFWSAKRPADTEWRKLEVVLGASR